MPDAENDVARMLAEATVYDTLMDTNREFPVDPLSLAKDIIRDLLDAGVVRVIPPDATETYTREDMARAWDEGARNGSRGLLPEKVRNERNPYRPIPPAGLPGVGDDEEQ